MHDGDIPASRSRDHYKLPNPEEETLLWEGRPSFMLLIPASLAGLVLWFGLTSGYGWLVIHIPSVANFFGSDNLPLWATAIIEMFPVAIVAVLAMTTRYRISNQRFFMDRGILWRHLDQVELVRVRDISVGRNLIDLFIGTGSIYITSRDMTIPLARFWAMRNAAELADGIRRVVLEAQTEAGYSEREVT